MHRTAQFVELSICININTHVQFAALHISITLPWFISLHSAAGASVGARTQTFN